MALPHSPGRVSDLSAMGETDRSSIASTSSRKSGSSLLSKLVAGKHPFSKSARKRLDPVGVPPRTTSLAANERDLPPIPSPSTANTVGNYRTASTDSSRSNLEQLHEPVANPNPAPIHHEAIATTASVQQTASGKTALEQQREELVQRVVEEARKNKKAPLDENGRRVFEQAGFGHLIDKKGDVEVETHWLKPVVQVS
jgi:hypothetical protein